MMYEANGVSSMYRSPEFIVLVMLGDEHPSDHADDNAGDELDDAAEASTSGPSGSNTKNVPTALQTVDGKPRIDGILRWVEESGVTDAVIPAPEWQHQGLSAYLRSRKSSAKDTALLPGDSSSAPAQSMKIDLSRMDEEHRYSDSECIRNWAEKNPYKSAELIILTPEFLRSWTSKATRPIPPLSTILDRHRMDENLLTTLIYEKPAVTSKKQKEAEEPPMMIAFDSRSSTLLDVRDLDEFEEDVAIRNSLLRKYPILNLSTKLVLSHIYVCSNDILPLLNTYYELHSFSEEIVPFLSKAQWQSRLLAKALNNRRRSRSTTVDVDEEDVKSPSGREEEAKKERQHSQRQALEKSSTRPPNVASRSRSMKVACIVQR